MYITSYYIVACPIRPPHPRAAAAARAGSPP